MEAAEEKLLKAYKAKAKAWRRQVGQYRRAKQKQTKAEGKKPAPVKIAEGVEPDGAVDLLRMTAPPHSIHPPTYRWEPDGAVDLLRTTVSPHALFTRRPTGGQLPSTGYVKFVILVISYAAREARRLYHRESPFARLLDDSIAQH